MSPAELCGLCTAYGEDYRLVARNEHASSVVITNPVNDGHLLVLPKRHITDVSEQNKDEDKDIMLLIKRGVKYLEETFHPDGFDIGVNLHSDAGSSVKHLHYH